jgi:hypothetical protein
VSLRSIGAALLLTMLFAVSLGGAVCEASCVPAVDAHGCCPARMSSGTQAALANPADCAHPAHEQAGLLAAVVFVMPVTHAVATLEPARFIAAPATRAVPAAASPPVFPLRI